MKTAIVYFSYHHNNTENVVKSIANERDVTVFDGLKESNIDISGYERIGIASGIAFGKFYPEAIKFASEQLPTERDVFFIYTAGSPSKSQVRAVSSVAEQKKCKVVGSFCCKGFDTYGPFKVVGGIAKGHPTDEELRSAVDFYDSL